MKYDNYLEHYRKDAETFDYQQPYNSQPGQVERRRAELIRRQLDKSMLKPGSFIVDVGAGGGVLLKELARVGCRPIGLDIALLNLRRIARQSGNVKGKDYRLLTGDACHLPFKDASIDAVIFSEVIEHLEEPRSALKEAARVLKPGGQLVITVPYKEKIIHHLCIHCNRLTPSNAHLHSFDRDAMHAFLKDLPLTIERETFFHNKVLNLLEGARRMRSFPYPLWRAIDRTTDLIIKKPFYYLLLARK